MKTWIFLLAAMMLACGVKAQKCTLTVYSYEDIDRIIATVTTSGILTNRVDSGEQFPDSDDAVFYEVAMSKEGAFVVTGNLKHFPRKPIVVTPAEMVEILGI
jgi:hypothetical protein